MSELFVCPKHGGFCGEPGRVICSSCPNIKPSYCIHDKPTPHCSESRSYWDYRGQQRWTCTHITNEEKGK